MGLIQSFARRPLLPLLLVFLFALGVRLATVVALWESAPAVNDQVQRYDPIALSLLAGDGFTRGGSPDSSSPPVYPLFLAAVYGIFGYSPLSFRLALAVIDAATVAVVFSFGRQLLGPVAGLLASLGAAFLPYTAVLVVWGGNDVLYLFLHTLFLAIFTRAWITGRARDFALAGVLLAGATLCRAVPLLLPVALVAVLLAAGRGSWRRRGLQAAVLVLVFAAVLSPWMVRNWIAFERFVPVQTLGGLHFALAVTDRQEREAYLVESEPVTDRVTRDRDLYRVALEKVRREPGAFLQGVARRQVQMWSRTHSRARHDGLLAANLALLALAATGVAIGRPRWALVPLVTVVLYYVALHSVLLALFRYLLPTLPALLLLASIPLARLLARRPGSFDLGSSSGSEP